MWKNIGIILRSLIKVDKSYLRAVSLLIWKHGNGLLPTGPLSLLEMLVNSQINSWQSHALKIELRFLVHSVSLQSVSGINASQELKEHKICFIVWKWNVSKTTFREDCLFSGQQTESRPVNLSPSPQKTCTNAVFLLFCKKVPLKARAAAHSPRLSCQSAANSSATNVQNWLLLVDTNCIYSLNVSKYKCKIWK